MGAQAPDVAGSSEEYLVDNPRFLCPYLDRRDARCADLLTLMNIREAFRLCAGDHESCTIFHQIRRAEARADSELLVAQSA